MPLYPPALIYLALPLTWSLSFFCLLHLWFAGFGMYQLARRWTGNDFAAAFAGVAFSFNGLTLNLLMWPSHIATLSWMPWVVLAVEGAWREGGRKIFLAAMVGALQMLAGGPETIFFTWLLLLVLWIQQFATGGEASSPNLRRRVAATLAMFWRFPAIVALVIALAAAQLLPFLDLAAHSQRETGFARTSRWSMPAWGWANFLVPMAFGGTWQHGRLLSIRPILDIILLSRHRNALACAARRLDAARTARLASRPPGRRGADICAWRKHARLSRPATDHSAVEPDHLSGQILLLSWHSLRRCSRRLRWRV